MSTVYFTEITSDDDEPDATHDGEEVEQLEPCTLPVHTLTADMVAAAVGFHELLTPCARRGAAWRVRLEQLPYAPAAARVEFVS